MKILLINNFYYNRGGDCTYMFSLKKLLEQNGHEIITFSMNHPQNFECKDSKYFVSYINYAEEVKKNNISTGIKVLGRTIFSKEAKNKIEDLIREEKPDIAHLQNIHHHITPSILYSLRANKIPIVWTLHDYTLICPNTSFLSHGMICEKCKKRKYYWPLFTRCKKNSFGASAVAALETTIHRILRINNLVDIFIAPSKFLRDKFIEYGFNPEKIIHLDHFIDYPVAKDICSPEDYYLFVGRIAEEKGIKTLIDAAIRTNLSRLKIAGGGPLIDDLKKYVAENDKENRIEFLGHKSRKDLLSLYKKSKFLVVPSEWYENSGLIIFEAFACGKPVLGSNIGGIPELVKDGERGLICNHGSIECLASSIKYLIDNQELTSKMGENARNYLRKNLNDRIHYTRLMDIYKKVS